MIKNISLKEIGNKLQDADSILLFPHENADGDALGSCMGLCITLRNIGKEAFVCMGEEPAEYISFIADESCICRGNVLENPDVTMCIDCSGENRIPGRFDRFNSGKVRITIDHHVTDCGFGDFYYIDETAAATGELIFTLIGEMGEELSIEAAEAIFAAISSDTGNFKYSNTTPDTHEIAAALLRRGIDQNKLMVDLYQNVDIRQMKVQAEAFAKAEIFAGGKGAITCVSRKMLEDIGAGDEHGETVIDYLRDIRGVEIAAVLKERDRGMIKVSLRAKSYGKVNEIAGKFGGGGHVKAAGCTLEMSMDEAWIEIRSVIEEAFDKGFGGIL